MKKTFKTITFICMVLLMTGCYSLEAKMNIKPDKSMDFTIFHAADEELLKEINPNESLTEVLEIDKIKKNLIPRGYEIKDYHKGNIKGVTISKTIDNIDEISKEGDEIRVTLTDLADEFFNDKVFFTVKKGLVFNVYTATFIFENDDKIKDNVNYQNTINYEVVLPVKSISNNATNVSSDGKYLTWELDSTKTNEVNYSFKLADKTNLYFAYASIALIILLFIIAITTALGNKKRKKALITKNKIEEPIEDKKVDIKNNGVDLMKDPTPINSAGIDLMKAPDLSQISAPQPLHNETGPAVNIDAPGVVINAEPTNIVSENVANILEQTRQVDNNILNNNNLVDEIKSQTEEINNRGVEIETNAPIIIKPVDTAAIEVDEDVPTIINEMPINIDAIEQNMNEEIVNIDLNIQQPMTIPSFGEQPIQDTLQSTVNQQEQPQEKRFVQEMTPQEENFTNIFEQTFTSDTSINVNEEEQVQIEPINNLQEQQPIANMNFDFDMNNQVINNVDNNELANTMEVSQIQQPDTNLNFEFDTNNQNISNNIDLSQQQINVVEEVPTTNSEIEQQVTEMNLNFDLSNQAINNETDKIESIPNTTYFDNNNQVEVQKVDMNFDFDMDNQVINNVDNIELSNAMETSQNQQPDTNLNFEYDTNNQNISNNIDLSQQQINVVEEVPTTNSEIEQAEQSISTVQEISNINNENVQQINNNMNLDFNLNNQEINNTGNSFAVEDIPNKISDDLKVQSQVQYEEPFELNVEIKPIPEVELQINNLEPQLQETEIEQIQNIDLKQDFNIEPTLFEENVVKQNYQPIENFDNQPTLINNMVDEPIERKEGQ